MLFPKETADGQISWEELRRQARTLENELDTKLVSLGSIGGVYDRSGSYGGLSCREEFNQNYARCSKEIEEILEKLTRVNDQMAGLVHDAPRPTVVPPPTNPNQASASGGPMSQQMHTAKRHREILRDYMQEFRQTKSKVMAAREREDLLGSVYRDLNSRDTGNSLYNPNSASNGQDIGSSGSTDANSAVHSSSTRLLLDEQDKIHRSNRLIDDHLSAASTIRATLRAQRLAIKGATTGLHNLMTRFPRIKHLVSAIDCRQRQDSLVLGVVIGLCVVFLIIYKLT